MISPRVSGVMLGMVACMFVGCQSKPRVPKNQQALKKLPDEYETLSLKVGIIADSQFHYLYGDPTIMRTGLFDKAAKAAIRPVQLDLFAPDVMSWILDHMDSETVIHLGDSADLGCTGEFNRFTSIMRGSKKRWVMAPGNHDSFFFGNLQMDADNWKNACDGYGEPLTKDRYLRTYLGELTQEGDAALDEGMKEFAQYLHSQTTATGIWTDEWHYQGSGHPLLLSVAWRIDPSEPWRSYIIQELNISEGDSSNKVRAILFDTANYEEKPTLVPSRKSLNAGIFGQITTEQLEKAEKWLSKKSPDTQIFFMGHHPYDAMEKDTQKSFDRLRTQNKVVTYVSAHTHSGGFIAHGAHNDPKAWVEINVGSITDWPIEFHLLQLHRAKKNGQLILSPNRQSIERLWSLKGADTPQCNNPALISKPSDDDYFLKENRDFNGSAKLTQRRLLRTMISSYERMLAYSQTSDTDSKMMETLLGEAEGKYKDWKKDAADDADSISRLTFLVDIASKLDELQQKRDVLFRQNPSEANWKDQEFRLCQAYWASKYSVVDYSLKNRIPGVENLSLALPLR